MKLLCVISIIVLRFYQAGIPTRQCCLLLVRLVNCDLCGDFISMFHAQFSPGAFCFHMSNMSILPQQMIEILPSSLKKSGWT